MPVEEIHMSTSMLSLAIITWAVSGAVIARSKDFDFMGVFIIAVVASVGGGLIRDGIFLQTIPELVLTPLFLFLPLTVVIFIIVFGDSLEKLKWWKYLANFMDAFGIPVFTLLGFQLATIAGIPIVGAIFVGLINGVSGGVLRDILVGDTPQLLRPGQLFGSVSIFALILYIIFVKYGNVDSAMASWTVVALATIINVLSVKFNWQSKAVNKVSFKQHNN